MTEFAQGELFEACIPSPLRWLTVNLALPCLWSRLSRAFGSEQVLEDDQNLPEAEVQARTQRGRWPPRVTPRAPALSPARRLCAACDPSRRAVWLLFPDASVSPSSCQRLSPLRFAPCTPGHCSAARQGALLPPLQPHHPPRHEAAEHPHRVQPRREALRLRVRPRHVEQHPRSHLNQGNAALHGSRARPGTAVQPHGGPVVARRDPVRCAQRPPSTDPVGQTEAAWPKPLPF